MEFEKVVFLLTGMLSTLIGGWHFTLQILLILMFIDIITGILKSWYKCQFNSRDFRKGLISKAGFFIVLILSFQLDALMRNIEPVIRTITCIFYITIEGTSIVENLGQMGVPIPKIISKRLKNLNEFSEEIEIKND